MTTRQLGEYYELLFASTLKEGCTQTQGNFPEYDLITESGKRIEVKTENTMWQKSGNHYIEFFNKDKLSQSGISLTTSDFWVIALAEDKKLHRWIRCRTSDLQELIKSNKWKIGEAKNENDVNSLGFLIPIIEIEKIQI